MNAEFTFRDSSIGDQIELRHLGLGLQPLVLIEPNDDGTAFEIDVTDLDLDELANLFEWVAESIRAHQAVDDE